MRNFRFKRIFTGVMTLFLAASVLTSCDKKGEGETQYIPVQLTEGGAWVFINPEGERVGNQEWEFEPTVTVNNIFTARTDSGLTVYKWKGDVATPIDSLTNLVSVGEFNEGLLPVTPPMQRIRVVNGDGDVKFVLNPIDGVEVTSCASKVSEGLLIVNTVDGKAGVVNTKGEVVVKPKYSNISSYSDGYAVALIDNFDNYDKGPEYYILDKEGNAKKVKGKFGYSEGECFNAPEFVDGWATVPAEMDTVSYEFRYCEFNTEGEVKKLDALTSVYFLDNGGKIINKWSEEGEGSYEWLDSEGKKILKVSGGDYMEAMGKYVGVKGENQYTLYNDNGEKILNLKGNITCTWPGGKFGVVVGTMDEDYNFKGYNLYNEKGEEIPNLHFYGLGSNTVLWDNDSEDYYPCDDTVTSAYVDVTAAATKLVSMTSGGVKGKEYYALGESVADILSGENARFYSGSSRQFSIPTPESTYYLANGAGFWITGTGLASANIVAPTYQNYFEVHHYDYYGRAWGWNRQRQVGVHFNQNAKVVAFDIVLHTNHSSGKVLREAISRRLKTEGYTIVEEANNYDEYTNGYQDVVIYGTPQSNGVGAYIANKGSLNLSNDEKAALAATI